MVTKGIAVVITGESQREREGLGDNGYRNIVGDPETC